MFPIGLMGIILLYICERWQLAYLYRRPVEISDDLNKSCIKDILRAPFYYFAFGFWFFSNRQIFENIVEPKEYLNDAQKMNHEII